MKLSILKCRPFKWQKVKLFVADIKIQTIYCFWPLCLETKLNKAIGPSIRQHTPKIA